MATLHQFRQQGRRLLNTITGPISSGLLKIGVTPSQISTMGVVFAVAAAIAIVFGAYPVAGVLYLIAGLVDALDGVMARRKGVVSRVGAFLDSTTDRIVEGIVLAGLTYHFAALGRPLDAMLVVLLLTASVLISYTRARAEALGIDCTVGIITRAERIVILGGGLLLALPRLTVYVLLVLSVISAGQRIAHSVRHLARHDDEQAAEDRDSY